jgi:hypothetical protein
MKGSGLSKGPGFAVNTYMSDLEACVITPEHTKRELEAIERRLGERLGIQSGVRMALLALEFKGELEHCDDVAEWQQTYASYLDWMAEEAEEWSDDPVMGDSPPPPRPADSQERTERATNDVALSLLCVAVAPSSNKVPARWPLTRDSSDFSIASSPG